MTQNLFDYTTPQEYVVDNVEALFDSTGKAIDPSDVKIPPFDVIKAMANALGQTINNPKPGCKHCYGKGYVGRDSKNKAPIPCLCIYPSDKKAENDRMFERTKHMNRSERRQWEKTLKQQMKKNKVRK